ncbi:Response regulator receiver domain-containing protein [Flexibacter flexilis DSM 6793]|uniref:Response regulator receiver domain-containing protein n=1 Tax=Flexibacter flexilis DSM 6793 TaxID=927664 RepID=A0A1I1DG12_9BACT|nr:response regulator [Flexibacter flexilis]SFB73777.1 Response regulator receiver domain-containing protein [Flexibacter flexilis DSM 6793]
MTTTNEQDEPINILIVEDNSLNLQVLTDFLGGNNYNFLIAQEGNRAISIARRRKPDLILLDINLPGMNGFEICKILKADPETQDIPIIFISALNQIENKVNGFKVGGTDYIVKPFQKEEVIVRVDSQIKLYQLNKQLRRNYEDLAVSNEELSVKSNELHHLNTNLEALVEERTEELSGALRSLQASQSLIEHKNKELQQTIDQLLRTRAGKRATTIVLVVSFSIFLVEEILENIFQNFAQSNFYLLLSFKFLLLLLLKPIELILESTMIKRSHNNITSKIAYEGGSEHTDS